MVVPVMTGKYSVAFLPAELQTQHGIRTFRLERTCCYESLLVDEERGRLFVGAENHVASLSLDNISKRAKKVPGTPPPNLTQLQRYLRKKPWDSAPDRLDSRETQRGGQLKRETLKMKSIPSP